MRKRAEKDIREYTGKLMVRTEGLMCIADSGRDLAVAIGTFAGARVQIGRAVFWNVEKVKAFLENYSEEDQQRVKAFLDDEAKKRKERKEEREREKIQGTKTPKAEEGEGETSGKSAKKRK